MCVLSFGFFSLSLITSFALAAPVLYPLALEASERGDCCQLLIALSPRPKGHRFKSHLSRTNDVRHLSWLAVGPNKVSLIGKG